MNYSKTNICFYNVLIYSVVLEYYLPSRVKNFPLRVEPLREELEIDIVLTATNIGYSIKTESYTCSINARVTCYMGAVK